jgi:hemerythrin-like domain-containing protein
MSWSIRGVRRRFEVNSDLIVLIDRLESEHVDVRRALETLGPAIEESDSLALRAALAAGVEALGTALDVHSEAEDEDLFPRIAAMTGDGVVNAFVEEHMRIRALRDQVYESMGRGEADLDGCAELCELLGDHIQREDRILFPAARSWLAD